jgi:hypothetical protein
MTGRALVDGRAGRQLCVPHRSTVSRPGLADCDVLHTRLIGGACRPRPTRHLRAVLSRRAGPSGPADLHTCEYGAGRR